MPNFLKAALMYAQQGYYIFPCIPKAKSPLTKNGFKDATTDPVQIKKWWKKWPNANIGLVLDKSNLLVVDLDRHAKDKDGIANYKKLEGFKKTETVKAITGGEGIHLIFKAPASKVKGLPSLGIDIKTNGYILVEPSTHPSGKPYYWGKGTSILNHPIADCPNWLLHHIQKAEKNDKAINSNTKKDKDSSASTNKKEKYPASSALAIKQRCSFLSNSFSNAPDLSEPEWYHGIGVLAYTVEGTNIVHEFSRPHPRYSEAETNKKLEHWKVAGHGPPTCSTIEEKCGDEWCKTCPYNGHIKSPIVLGYAPLLNTAPKSPPQFPSQILPKWANTYVLELSKSIGTTTDFVACCVLANLSGLIGNTYSLKLSTSWIESANLWFVLVGEPSSGKSPALKNTLKPIKKIERKLYNAYQNELMLYEQKKKIYEADLAAWKKAKKEGAEEALPPAEPKKPVLKRLSITDITIEALGEKLCQNPMGLILASDELASWIGGMNQYKGGKGADRSNYLSIWSSTAITIDRKGKDPLHVEKPFLTIIGGIQPDILQTMQNKLMEDGFKERFLYSYPAPVTSKAKLCENTLKQSTIEAYESLLIHWFSNRPNEYKQLTLSKQAENFFDECHEQWQATIDHTNRNLSSYYLGKMSGYLSRLSIILHIMQHMADAEIPLEVNKETIEKAKKLCEYFIVHGQQAMGTLYQGAEESTIHKYLDWIRSKQYIAISPRDIHTNRVAGCKKSSQARHYLKLLQDYGYGYWNNEKDRLILYQE
jgi:hypothetical protein